MKKKRRVHTTAKMIIVPALLAGIAGCADKKEPKMISETDFFLGTTCTVQLYGDEHKDKFEPVFDILQDIEDKMSVKVKDSEISRINSMAGREAVEVSEDTFTVVEKAMDYSELSKGRFDLTIKPLIDLWGIGTDNQRIPSEEEIGGALNKIDYTKVDLDSDASTVFLEEEGMGIDLGGIAKGYAADLSVQYLKEHGVEYGIVNFGGNVYAFGEKYGETPWKIGVQKPEGTRGEYLGIVEVTDKTVVTSGKYERFFEKDGVKYHHILGTNDGYPVENNLSSVTVIAESSLDADALSTLFFTLGLEEGVDMAENMEEIEAVFYTEDDSIRLTGGLEESFSSTE
ncbi:MAG: FAD:protein FMN transferase [Spirochaetaceae bacterium]